MSVAGSGGGVGNGSQPGGMVRSPPGATGAAAVMGAGGADAVVGGGDGRGISHQAAINNDTTAAIPIHLSTPQFVTAP